MLKQRQSAEEVEDEFVFGHSGVALVVAQRLLALGTQDEVIDEELAVGRAGLGGEHHVGGVSHDLRLTAHLHHDLSSDLVLDSHGGDGCAWPETVAGDAPLLELLSPAEGEHGHAVLADGVGRVVLEPLLLHVQGRRNGQHLRVARLLQVRQTRLSQQESPPDVYLVDQVVTLHRQVFCRQQGNGTGIVDHYVNASEGFHHLLHTGLHLFFAADVTSKRKGLASLLLDLFGSCVDGARQFRVGCGGFGQNSHVGSVLCAAQGDGEAYAAGGAGDDDGLALEGAGRLEVKGGGGGHGPDERDVRGHGGVGEHLGQGSKSLHDILLVSGGGQGCLYCQLISDRTHWRPWSTEERRRGGDYLYCSR